MIPRLTSALATLLAGLGVMTVAGVVWYEVLPLVARVVGR